MEDGTHWKTRASGNKKKSTVAPARLVAWHAPALAITARGTRSNAWALACAAHQIVVGVGSHQRARAIIIWWQCKNPAAWQNGVDMARVDIKYNRSESGIMDRIRWASKATFYRAGWWHGRGAVRFIGTTITDGKIKNRQSGGRAATGGRRTAWRGGRWRFSNQRNIVDKRHAQAQALAAAISKRASKYHGASKKDETAK